ncbi:MAG TPA: hypothetical protein PLX06_12515 [Fimbriimonadaceae bacterium]|nr:hypothetical protein [Fimbriimonadaceae bacterium]
MALEDTAWLEDSRLGLFGTRRQTVVLILLSILEESYPRELSRLSGVSLTSVLKQLEDLEIQGVLASRLIGNQRRTSLNPRWFAFKPLKELLARLAEAEPELQETASRVRRRPRRKGKPL